MIPNTFAELTATEFATWIRDRAATIAEHVRAGRLSEASGMLKGSGGEDIGAAVAATVFASLSIDTATQALADRIGESVRTSHRLARGSLLRYRKANPVKWEPTRERFAYGYRATLRNRGAEVLRIESGKWAVFPQRDGVTIWCGAAPDYRRDRYEFRTARVAKRHAADYVRTGRFMGTDLDTLPLAKGNE